MRVLPGPGLWPGYLYQLKHLHTTPPGFPARHVLVTSKGLGDLLSDGQDRIQRGHWLLKDHGDVTPPDVPDPLLIQVQKIGAIKEDLPLDLGRRTWQKPEDGEGGNALAATALSHQTKGLTPKDLNVQTVHCIDNTFIGVKSGTKTANGKKRSRLLAHSLNLGSRASRNPSPKRLKLKTAKKMAMPGKVATWGALKI